MKKLLLMIVVLNGLLAFAPVVQAQTSQMLGKCLTDSLNGRERKQLAQWIFFGMASHPELNTYTKISAANRDEMDQTIGKLITRLLTADCGSQAAGAMKNEGPSSIENAFRIVGEVAMKELMTDQNVSTSLTNFQKYLDKEKLGKLGK